MCQIWLYYNLTTATSLEQDNLVQHYTPFNIHGAIYACMSSTFNVRGVRQQ